MDFLHIFEMAKKYFCTFDFENIKKWIFVLQK